MDGIRIAGQLGEGADHFIADYGGAGCLISSLKRCHGILLF
jgi:hypothetical protein